MGWTFRILYFAFCYPYLSFKCQGQQTSAGQFDLERMTCSQDRDCRYQELRCLNGVCECPQDMIFFQDRGRCYKRIRRQEDHCEISEQCANFARSSYCNTDGRCICPPDLLLQISPSPKCLPKESRNNGRCDLDRDCASGQVCQGGSCTCPSGTFFDSSVGTCRTESGNSGRCYQDRDCRPGQECRQGYCSCPSGTYLDPSTGTCRGGNQNVASCSQDRDCRNPGQVCRSGYCSCPSGTYLDQLTGACSGGNLNNVRCNDDRDCFPPMSSCAGNFCSCPPGTYFDSPTRTCRGDTGGQSSGPCMQDSDCTYGDQRCLSGQCVCPERTFLVESRRKCFNRILSGSDHCEVQEQCDNYSLGSNCVNGKCCYPSYLKFPFRDLQVCRANDVSSTFRNISFLLLTVSVLFSVS